MLVDEQNCDILTFRERFESLLNRRDLRFGVDDEEVLLVLFVNVANPGQ